MLDMTKLEHAEIYCVGGYVRNRLMGLTPKDHDFVVCGATPRDMIDAGFIPINASAFPVFHHPITRDEFALARTEKKVGIGYHGFDVYTDPSITIEEDLFRRDLTVNSLARKVIGWNDLGHAKLSDEIIDPFGGREDLQKRKLRHVSDAFREDPVRVLRVARFAAQYGFEVDLRTAELMMYMVEDGELDHLTAERVYAELEKAMAGDRPGAFFEILYSIGATDVIMPVLADFAKDASCVVDRVMDPQDRFAVMALGMGESRISKFFDDLKAPVAVKHLALKTEKLRVWLATYKKVGCTTENCVELFKQLDVLRKPEDLEFCIRAYDQVWEIEQKQLIVAAAKAFCSVNLASLQERGVDTTSLVGPAIGQAINEERTRKVREVVEAYI